MKNNLKVLEKRQQRIASLQSKLTSQKDTEQVSVQSDCQA